MHSREEKASLERLAADLRTVRTQSEKTLTEVHEDTRIPLEVLRKLESNLLSGDSMFNDVYIRSILRSFAEAVGAEPTQIQDAFKRASVGAYLAEHSIAAKGASPAEKTHDSTSTTKKGHKKAKTKGSASGFKKKEPTNEDRAPTESPKKTKPKTKFSFPKFDFKKGTIGVLVLAAVLTGIYGVFQLTKHELGTNSVSGQDAMIVPGARDGDPATVNTDASDPEPEPFMMPDMVRVKVFPENGIFDPIRVRIDRDLRRPYWADSTDTLAFEFRNRMIVENHVNQMNILVENETYPIEPSGNSITLTRKVVQQFLERRNSGG